MSDRTENSKINGYRRPVTAVVLLLALVGCGPVTFVMGLSPGNQQLVETVVKPSGKWFASRVVVIDVSGVINNTEKRLLWNRKENPVSLLDEKLAKAQRDTRIKAVILRINSPGGTVAASDAMYGIIERFKEESHKPVIALMTDIAASGGYYIACASDQILAYPTAITGSIGVIVQTVSLKPALTRIGIHTEALTSGPNKDAGSPLSDLTASHRAVLQTLVDDFYQRFLDVVRKARPNIATDDFEQVTDGRVVTGLEGARVGLVDRTGDLFDAFELAKQLAGVEQADLVLYHRPMAYVGSPYTVPAAAAMEAGTGNIQINLAQINLPDTPSRSQAVFYYLWQP